MAISLLKQTYYFLKRLDNVLQKAHWIHTSVSELIDEIESFLPDLKE